MEVTLHPVAVLTGFPLVWLFINDFKIKHNLAASHLLSVADLLMLLW